MALREMLLRLDINVDRRAEQKANAAIQRVTKSAQALAGIFSAGIIFRGLAGFVNDASDAAESANKFATVFTDAADEVASEIERIGEKTGQSTLEIEEFASSIGALVKPFLGTSKAAGEVSTAVAELALDIASADNESASEALIALRSGLIGSAEPLQKFGVDVRVAAIEQEALRLGINKSNKELTEAERIQIRLAAITRQLGSRGAIGDATRTADEFANSTRALQGQLKLLRVQIGQALLPAAQALVNGFKTLVQFLQSDMRMTLTVLGGIFGGLAIAAVVAASSIIASFVAAAAPFILVGLLLGLLIEDFMTFREGGTSAIGAVIDSFDEFLGSGTFVSNAIQTAFATLVTVVEAFGAALGNIAGFIVTLISGNVTGAFDAFFSFIEEQADRVFGPLLKVVDGALEGLNSVAAAVGGATLRDLASGIGDIGSSALDGARGLLGVSSAGAQASGPINTNNASASQNNDVQININAPGGDAQAIGNAAGSAVGDSLEAQTRTLQNAFVAGGA